MADAARHIPRMTAEEYLRVESQSTCRHEFVDGIVYAMVGASRRHNTIALDIRGLLRARLAAPCQPYALEVKVQVKTQLTDRFYYPDVVVSCSELDDASWEPEFVFLEDTLAFESVDLTIPARNIYRDIPF